MRDTDAPETFRPLGERVVPSKPLEPEWQPYKDREGNVVRGVEVDRDGKVRTDIPLPKLPRWFPL